MAREVDEQPIALAEARAVVVEPVGQCAPVGGAANVWNLVRAIRVKSVVVRRENLRQQLIDAPRLFSGNKLHIARSCQTISKKHIGTNVRAFRIAEKLLEKQDILLQRNLVFAGLTAASDDKEMIPGRKSGRTNCQQQREKEAGAMRAVSSMS